jgi:hypothetical protein
MAIFNEFPYTNMHELNLDWILAKVKELAADWAAVNTQWDTMQQMMENLEAYIHNYFEELDVQDEIDVVMAGYVADGTLQDIIYPFIPNEVGVWLTSNITQPSTPPIDASLTVQDAAADAQAVGAKFGPFDEHLSFTDVTVTWTPSQGQALENGDIVTAQTSDFYVSNAISVQAGDIYLINLYNKNTYQFYVIKDSQNNILDSQKSKSSLSHVSKRITMPENSNTLIISYFDPVNHPPVLKKSTGVFTADYLSQDALDQIQTYFGLTPA